MRFCAYSATINDMDIIQGAATLYPGLCAFALTAHNAYGIRVITPRLAPKARSILPF